MGSFCRFVYLNINTILYPFLLLQFETCGVGGFLSFLSKNVVCSCCKMKTKKKKNINGGIIFPDESVNVIIICIHKVDNVCTVYTGEGSLIKVSTL